MGLIDDIWYGNCRPNLYEPDTVEQHLVEQLATISETVRTKYPDDTDIQGLIDVCSKLMVHQSGRAFNEGVKFGFYFANEINGRNRNEK